MAPAQMAYPPAAYTGFPGVAPSSSMMGGMMAPSVGMMAQPGAAGMVTPMAIPAGYVGNVQAAVIGVPNGMMAAQQAGYVAGMAAVPQPVYGVQPAQQLQWNITQVRGGLLLTRGWMEGGGGTGSKLPVPGAVSWGWVRHAAAGRDQKAVTYLVVSRFMVETKNQCNIS